MRRAVLQLFGGNLASKAMGLGREVLVAGLFGTGAEVGAFRVAQAGTLAPANFFASDSLNAVFTPLYKHVSNSCTDTAQGLVWALLGIFGVLSLLIVFALWVGAGPWVASLAPGLDGDTAVLASHMVMVMGVGIPFYLISAVVTFVSMARGDFLPMSIRPVLQNGGLIGGVLLAFWMKDVTLFGWGFSGSYIAFCVWALSRARGLGHLPLPKRWDWSSVRGAMINFWVRLRPLLLLPLLLQGNTLVERAVASVIGISTVSALDYARFVTETLIFLIALPIGVAGLSNWSGVDQGRMVDQLRKVLILLLLTAIPLSAFLAVHAHLVVEILYRRGAFDPNSVRVTGDILFGIAVGLWSQVVGYVFVRGLSAQFRNRAVFYITVTALFANVACNLLFYKHVGPMVLGLGNTAYGMVLLVGTSVALGIWRDVLAQVRVFVVGLAVYLLIDNWLPMPDGPWGRLAVTVGFASVYWLTWVGLLPNLRSVVLELVAPKGA